MKYTLFPLCCTLLLFACAPQSSRPPQASRTSSVSATSSTSATQHELPRAAPVHVQWLEKQSMLRKSPEITALVSGSTLGMRAPAGQENAATLLQSASTWFLVNPETILGTGGTLGTLQAQGLPRMLEKMGIHGLLVAPAAENGNAWFSGYSEENRGEDAVGYGFADNVGTDDDYAALEQSAAALNVFLGGNCLPAATGMGPDFLLATRGVRDYPGLYLMAEVPENLWAHLPLPVKEETTGQVLDKKAVAALGAAGFIPPAFARDNRPGFAPSGWAATSEVLGVDGVKRRWIYRYAYNPSRPVLNWDDPSGTAKRVLAASIIRQVGLLHQPLASLSVADLWGQDPAPGKGGNSPEPGLSALASQSRDARRYGGWALLRDYLPLEELPRAQAAGVDFAMDSVTSPALEISLLRGDAGPLRQALEQAQSLHVQEKNLWRGVPSQLYANENIVPEAWRSISPATETWPTINGGALAAMALGLKPEDVKAALEDEKTRATLRAVLEAQLVFRAMRPGLFVVSAQDMAGLVFAPEHTLTGLNPLRAAVAISPQEKLITADGRMRGLALNAPLSDQLYDATSLAARLSQMLEWRETLHVAEGEAAPVPQVADNRAAAVLTLLPGGDYLLAAINVSGNEFITDVHFTPGLVAENTPGQDMVTGLGVAVNKDHLRLKFTPWQYRLVLLKAR